MRPPCIVFTYNGWLLWSNIVKILKLMINQLERSNTKVANYFNCFSVCVCGVSPGVSSCPQSLMQNCLKLFKLKFKSVIETEDSTMGSVLPSQCLGKRRKGFLLQSNPNPNISSWIPSYHFYFQAQKSCFTGVASFEVLLMRMTRSTGPPKTGGLIFYLLV